MPFKKFVQIGRVVFINEGKSKGKLACIVDVIDSNRALIDGPCTGVPRQAFKFSDMYLTSYLLKLQRSQRSKGVRLEWERKQISEKFAKSQWQKNLNKHKIRVQMTDFDRFKLGKARQSRNKIINEALLQIKSVANKKAQAKKKLLLEKKAAKKAKRAAALAKKRPAVKTTKKKPAVAKAAKKPAAKSAKKPAAKAAKAQ